MNDLRKLTRIILIGLAISGLISGLMVLLATLPRIIFSDYYPGPSGIARFVSPLLAAIYCGLIIYFLLYKSGFWVEKIVRAEEPKESQPKVFWMPVAFRLVSVFAGILCLYQVVLRAMPAVRRYLTYRAHDIEAVSPYIDLVQIISWVILLAFGLYLLCGAPHFVRWQVKKTLEQCKEPGGFRKAEEEKPVEPTQP